MTELNCNEVVNVWGNFGDNDAIEYGTKFVKADEENENCFYVIEVINLNWSCGEEGWFLSQGYVDLSDDWIDWKAIKEFAGFDNTCQDTEKEYMVSALVEYYGIHEFNGSPLSHEFGLDFNGVLNQVFSEADVIALLNEYGILLERENEVLKATIVQYNDSEFTYIMKDDVESIGETLEDEGIIILNDRTKIIVSESLEDLQAMLEGYDIEVLEDGE